MTSEEALYHKGRVHHRSTVGVVAVVVGVVVALVLT